MPDFTDYIRRNLPSLGVPATREAEIVEELAIEVEERYQRALRCGLTPQQAWAEIESSAGPWQDLARELQSGEPSPEPSPEPPRGERLFAALGHELRRDLAYAARQLRRAPGFTLVAVLMLSLGIGANTAIFSLLNAVLLRHLPVQKPSELVFFGKARAEGNTDFIPAGDTEVFSRPFFHDFRRANQVFTDVAAIQSYLIESYGRIAAAAEPQKLNLEMVSGSYFRTLGINASAGRTLRDADDQAPGAQAVAVARYSWWHNRFGNASPASAPRITIGSRIYTIVGVAPPGFSGVSVGQAPDLWIPLAMQGEISPDRNGLANKWFRFLHIIGRVKPGVSRAQAQANTNVVFRSILQSYLGPKPTASELKDIRHAYIQLTPAATGRSRLRMQFTSPLIVLMVVVGMVLLIACANVANLLLARSAARQREIAVRMSLGAERVRLMRQLLAESALLAALGAAVGIAFAFSASRLLLAMVSTGAAMLPLQVAPDAGVLLFTLVITVATVFLFGTAPALRATALDLSTSLRTRTAASGGHGRLARSLVVGQVALSLVLLVGAGLFLRSLANLADLDVGFEKQNALRLHIDPGAAGYRAGEKLVSTMQRIEARIGSIPGVRAAGFALSVFDGGGWTENDISVPGRPVSEQNVSAVFNVVGTGYLDAMKMPLIAGRGLTERDNLASRKIAVINETMARDYFPGASPLGRTFAIGDEPEYRDIEVVGVVKDAKYFELEESQRPAVFFPYAQHPERFLYNIVVRYAGEPSSLAPEIRSAVRDIDPDLPVSDFRGLAALVDDFTLNHRLVADLSTFFGILAALLASIGIYGVMSYGIARRTNEFGIRMALGAGRAEVIRVVLREILVLSSIGVAAGLALALVLGRWVRGILFGVEPANPAVIAIAVLAIVGVALLAGYIPARRATRIDPALALRCE